MKIREKNDVLRSNKKKGELIDDNRQDLINGWELRFSCSSSNRLWKNSAKFIKKIKNFGISWDNIKKPHINYKFSKIF